MARRTLIVAFAGWTDAGDMATSATARVIEALSLEPLEVIEPDDYVDYQMARPVIERGHDGTRRITWPSTLIYGPDGALEEFVIATNENRILGVKEPAVFVCQGTEPHHRWTDFVAELIEIVRILNIDRIVVLGAMLGRTTHTRPVPITMTSESAELQRRFGAEPSDYEGPTGILSLIQLDAEAMGVPSMGLWATSPAYLSPHDCPPGAIALLEHLARILGREIDLGSLPQQAAAWRRMADAVVTADEDIERYVRMVEEELDSLDAEDVTGDDLAEQFEAFLRGSGDTPRGDDPPVP